ncbi:hypothetical protein A9F13_02g03729 [Clavispora lusitaniae]|uniref:Uncharacterized protein n=1 Tax=Clavispora lusitaniae TaxID=36911 RepID=A0AA91Q3N5_CLALS|nr:hypothetical protein A9F13_02g03729 [Clavispora lusitaniae]
MDTEEHQKGSKTPFGRVQTTWPNCVVKTALWLPSHAKKTVFARKFYREEKKKAFGAAGHLTGKTNGVAI